MLAPRPNTLKTAGNTPQHPNSPCNLTPHAGNTRQVWGEHGGNLLDAHVKPNGIQEVDAIKTSNTRADPLRVLWVKRGYFEESLALMFARFEFHVAQSTERGKAMLARNSSMSNGNLLARETLGTLRINILGTRRINILGALLGGLRAPLARAPIGALLRSHTNAQTPQHNASAHHDEHRDERGNGVAAACQERVPRWTFLAVTTAPAPSYCQGDQDAK